jgi:acyl-coenzyme A thioesterase PaaI-like protein
MKTPNPEFIKRVSEMVSTSPYFELLSMKLVDAGIGYSSLEIDLTQKHLQAAFWAVYFGIEDQAAGMTTVDLKLNYLAPGVSGKLIARGRQIKVGRTLGYAEAQVVNQDEKILAHGTSTVIILPGNARLCRSTGCQSR